jgi:peptide/nickel transport system permease protein
VVGSIVLPFFAPADPSLQATYLKNLPMSWEHLLGTNALGQDIFWFLVFAIRNSLILGVLVGVGVTIIATAVGLSAGYIGGNFERVVMLVVDSFITIPLLPILIILGAVIRGNSSFLTVGLIIVVFGWAWGARTIRSMALSLREREFINMARFSGAGTVAIIVLQGDLPVRVGLHGGGVHQHRAVRGQHRGDAGGDRAFEGRSADARLDHLLGAQLQRAVHRQLPLAGGTDRRDSILLFLGLFLTSTGFNAAFASKRGVA